MKVLIYFDVYDWTRKSEDLFPTTNPTKKSEGSKRYRVDVTIPDPAELDKVIEGEAKEVEEMKKEDKEE